MASPNLSAGAIAAICNGAADLKPFLQVVDLRPVSTANNTNERYRMVLSDGIHLQPAMLATQMNSVIKSGHLHKGSLVHLTEFICNLIQNRKIVIVINLEIVVEKCEPIGEPKPYVDAGATLTAQSSSINQPGVGAMNNQLCGGPSVVSSSLEQGRNGNAVANPYVKVENGAVPSSGIGCCNNPVDTSRSMSNSYGRPAQSSYNQQSSLYLNSLNRGPIAKNEPADRLVPIAALNPYQGRWTIKARVTAKGELRRYNNPRGEGKVFSFDLLDSNGGEIRATAFNTTAEQFYGQIEAGKVYLVSKGSLKPAQKNFNHLNNDWEIHLEPTSTIEFCSGEDSSIPKQQFNFRSIGDIEGMENNTMIDVIAIVCSISPATTILRKTGTETLKRTLQLQDASGRSVELTLWGSLCNVEGQQLQNMCDGGAFPVLAVKAVRVNEFNGKTIGTISSSQIFINPEFPEAHKLHEWYKKEGRNVSSVSISSNPSGFGRTDIRKTVSQIKDEGLGRSEKPDWITVSAKIYFMKTDNFWYTACPLMIGERKCNKKVSNNGDGMWHCERCDQSFPQCDYRYLLQLQIHDHTAATWVTAFQESGEEIMGISAKKLYMLKHEDNDDAKFNKILKEILFTQFIFKLKIKEEMFGDEQRVKSTVVKAEKINFSHESKYLVSLIYNPSTGDSDASRGSATTLANNLYMGIKQNTQFSGHGLGGAGFSDRYATTQQGYQMGQYGNSSGSARPAMGGNGAYIVCSNCGTQGHYSNNCPKLPNGQAQLSLRGEYQAINRVGAAGDSSFGKCFKCNQSGHWARDCPSAATNVNANYGAYARG